MIFYQKAKLYHAEDRLSKSGLDQLAKSPAHYQVWLAQPADTTPTLAFGQAAHCLLLEPDCFEEQITDQMPIRNNSNRIVLNTAQLEIIHDMVDIALEHSRIQRLLDGAFLEYSVYADVHGIPCKCKPDIMNPKLGIVADYKTAISAEYEDFSKAIWNYRYHVQAAFYMKQLEVAASYQYTDWLWIVQEKVLPFGIRIYHATDSLLERGYEDMLDNLITYKQCLATGLWPSYPEEVIDIDLPGWTQYK